MIKYILIIFAGGFFIWLAKWNLQSKNHGETASKINYWIWLVTGFVFLIVGAIYLIKSLI
jgi:hypothetical protein